MNVKVVRNRFWHRILAVLGSSQPKFRAAYLSGVSPEPFELQKIFVADTPDFYSYCPRCCEDICVTIMRDNKGNDVYYRVCCGVTRVSAKSLRVWQVRFEPVINLFKESVGINGTNSEIISDRVWNIGRRGQQQFIYINSICDDDFSNFIPVLSRFPKAVFVMPQSGDIECLKFLLNNRCVVLQDVGQLDENYFVKFDVDKIESFIMPEPVSISKRVAKRASRSSNIELLTSELKEHYCRSRDYYFNSNGQLLPRPTQSYLACQLGVRQDIVSRCLNDPNATLLKFLWDNAENPKAILKN
jgi:hypothetical protein